MQQPGCKGLGREAGEGGKKARKCHRGEDAFSGWAKACFGFSSLQLAAIFWKLDQLQKIKSFSLFNYSCGSPCAEGPSVPPTALGTDANQDDSMAVGNNARVKAFTSPTKKRPQLKQIILLPKACKTWETLVSIPFVTTTLVIQIPTCFAPFLHPLPGVGVFQVDNSSTFSLCTKQTSGCSSQPQRLPKSVCTNANLGQLQPRGPAKPSCGFILSQRNMALSLTQRNMAHAPPPPAQTLCWCNVIRLAVLSRTCCGPPLQKTIMTGNEPCKANSKQVDI